MRAVLRVYQGVSKTPAVVGKLEGDPIEILDLTNQLNARWPGRRAEVEVDHDGDIHLTEQTA